jgi:hypothetical protein
VKRSKRHRKVLQIEIKSKNSNRNSENVLVSLKIRECGGRIKKKGIRGISDHLLKASQKQRKI